MKEKENEKMTWLQIIAILGGIVLAFLGPSAYEGEGGGGPMFPGIFIVAVLYMWSR